MNLDKECRRQDVVNLNVDVKDGEAAACYRDKTNWSTWPEDLRNSSSMQTYVNISGNRVSSSSLSSTTSFAGASTPPPPPSVGPNTSPTKPKSNCELAQNMSELSLKSTSDSVSVTKKLDPGFLAELEKHLGEKEASKNTNASRNNQEEIPCTNYPCSSSLDKLRQDSSAQLSPAIENAGRLSTSIIPALKPPPQGKSKSPVTTTDHRASPSSSSTLPNKVQNSWQLKSTNVQRPLHQQSDQRASESTDAIIGQIWQQAQTLTQQNVCLADPSVSNHQSLPAVTAQEDVNLLEQVTRVDVSASGMNEAQCDPCNVTKVTFIQAQACSSTSQNYPQNMASINQNSIKLLQGTAGIVSGNSTNESRHGPCNVAKAAFNRVQVSLSGNQNYFQGLGTGQNAFNILQLATNNTSANSTNSTDSQYDASKANFIQTQICLPQAGQNYAPHNASTNIDSFNLLRTTASYVSANSATLSPWHGNCNIAKVTFNQACSSSHYLQNAPAVNQTGDFTLHQNCLQNAPMSFNASNVHGITHIQNNLQQQQDEKTATLLSEQVYAELKQTVCKYVYDFHNSIRCFKYISLDIYCIVKRRKTSDVKVKSIYQSKKYLHKKILI